MSFRSDNAAPIAPEIMAAMADANQGAADPYGDDPVTARMAGRLRALFEHDDAVILPVATGTAGNALALAALTPPWGTVLAHADAHIAHEECGAVTFYTGGGGMTGIAGADGKLTPAALREALDAMLPPEVHGQPPAAVSLTNLTEAGTCYTPDAVRALAEVAHARGLPVHLDGARLANAVAACGCTPAEMTWRAGVDAVTFGATKNGAMAAEAVILFDPARAEGLGYRRKRAGHLWSKMRFLSAQLDAYVSDDLWLTNARHANAAAARLAAGLSGVPGIELAYRVDGNLVFVEMSESAADGLAAMGYAFNASPGAWGTVARFAAGFATTNADVDRAIADVRAAATASHG